MSTLRVRQIIEGMDVVTRTNLKKQLPPKLKMPENETQKYPSALLGQLPDGESYSALGIIAENLLRLPSASITLETLVKTIKEVVPTFSPEADTKVRKSKTTQPFLDCLIATRSEVEKVLRASDGPLEFEPTIRSGSVEGHPDMKNKKQIFEIKLTGMLKKNWSAFLLQVFAYGAIDTETTDLYLVLPLQKTVWHADIRLWKNRTTFLNVMTSWSTKQQTTGAETLLQAAMLCGLYSIGSHTGKQKLLHTTVSGLGDYSRPYQIFLGGPQSSRFTVEDADIAATLGCITQNNAKVFVHSQYIINLCAKTDDWHTKLLIKNLQVTRAFGGKGVVVHVGKSTDQPLPEALEKMRTAIIEAKEHATEDCPLLLETPAGQGTETLKGMNDFIDFIESFNDKRIRMCLDTCHVYACGHKPLEYIQESLKKPGLLKLIHFNDSLGACGSCVDRHAYIGSGTIGMEGMTQIAEVCARAGLPMIVE